MSLARRPVRSVRFLAAPLALAALAGCGSSDAPTAPRGAFDPQALAASMTLPELGAAMAQIPGASIALSAAGGGLPGRFCAWSAAALANVCQPVTLPNGLRASGSWVALDAAGVPLAQPTAATAAAFRTVTELGGTLRLSPGANSSDPLALTIVSRAEQTLSGLLTGRRQLDGTSVVTSTIGVGSEATTLTATTTVVGLVLPAAGQRWPQAGTVTTRTQSGALAGTGLEQVMTFDGTSRVAVVVRGLFGAERRCTLDLARPAPDALLACLTAA